MVDFRRSARRQAADRAAGLRWSAWRDPQLAELARIAAAVQATMQARHREVDPEPPRRPRRAARRASDPLPRSLRRAANKPGGPRGQRPGQRLMDAAQAGLLTKANTTAGTAGRRAYDAVTYDARQERARVAARRRGEAPPTARAAAGHGYPGARFFGVPTTTGLQEVVHVDSFREASRVGLYLHDVGALVWDEITDRAFAARWGRRVRRAGGFESEADPARVRAMLRTEPPPPVRYEKLGDW